MPIKCIIGGCKHKQYSRILKIPQENTEIYMNWVKCISISRDMKFNLSKFDGVCSEHFTEQGLDDSSL